MNNFIIYFLSDGSQHNHLVRPEDDQLHFRQRKRVWGQLLGHHLREAVEPHGLVRVRSLLGLGHESAHHSTLWNLLECFNHVGAY